jgi:hypothetical protein
MLIKSVFLTRTSSEIDTQCPDNIELFQASP